MAGLCLFLSLIREHQNRIHMPRGFVDNSKGDVTDEKVNDGGFGDDILAADADGINVLLLNVGQHHATAVTDDLCRSIDDKGIGCIPESLLNVHSERFLAFIRKSDIALGDGDDVHGLTVQRTSPHRSALDFRFCRLTVSRRVLGSAERSDVDLYQDKHTPRCHFVFLFIKRLAQKIFL